MMFIVIYQLVEKIPAMSGGQVVEASNPATATISLYIQETCKPLSLTIFCASKTHILAQSTFF